MKKYKLKVKRSIVTFIVQNDKQFDLYWHFLGYIHANRQRYVFIIPQSARGYESWRPVLGELFQLLRVLEQERMEREHGKDFKSGHLKVNYASTLWICSGDCQHGRHAAAQSQREAGFDASIRPVHYHSLNMRLFITSAGFENVVLFRFSDKKIGPEDTGRRSLQRPQPVPVHNRSMNGIRHQIAYAVI